MKTNPRTNDCCGAASDFGLSRRSFLKTTTTAALGATFGNALAAETAKPASSETLVTTLYQSLTETQRQAIAFPFDHALRLKVDNNWHITEQRIGSDFYTPDQKAMVKEIFMGLHSPEYAETVYNQVVHDSGDKGFGDCSVALFGEPGTGKFEFVLTGRHCTRRCDGDSVEGAAFGGPIFYGHAAQGFDEPADHPGNAYWYQARRANAAFQMLDGKQREIALVGDARDEHAYKTVRLTGKSVGLEGIRMSELSKDQRHEVRQVLKDILAPYRESDAKEAMNLINENGFRNLHMAFFKNHDLGADHVWDVWQIEGPSMICYFRGEPHVHAWINIKKAPDALDAASA